MKSTGERFIPGTNGPIELEHMHRYWLASQFTSGKTVLDIACGEGYGSHILSLNAEQVTGVDISQETIDHASNRYQMDNLVYKVGSCASIPLHDSSIDVVVSFETIEHHEQHDEMMKEIKRVLKPSGLAIVSSPEKYAYSDLRNYQNPFHVKELYKEDFESLLAKYFKHWQLYTQRLTIGSLISKSGNLSTPSQHIISNDNRIVGNDSILPWYLIAFASDSEVDISCNSILESDIDSFLEAVLAPEKQNASEQISYRQSLVDDLNKLLLAEKANAEAQITHRDNIVSALQRDKDELESLLQSRKSLLKLLLKPRRQK